MRVCTGDNVFSVDGKTCLIYNIIKSVEGTHVVFKVFTQLVNFFDYPMSSDFLRVFVVSQSTAI